MQPLIFKHTVIAITVLALNCASAEQWSVNSADEFDASAVLRAPAATTVETLALDMSRIVGTQTMLIRYQATEYQRKVAEARARAYVAAVRRAAAEPEPSPKSTTTPKKAKAKEKEKEPEKAKPSAPKKGTAKQPPEPKAKETPEPKAKETPEPKAKQPPEPKAKETAKTKTTEPQVAAQPKKKLPRYIAVTTPKDKRTAPQVKEVVMIWDTHSESLVGNDLYDLQSPPPKGTMAKFDTYSAEYVGSGR